MAEAIFLDLDDTLLQYSAAGEASWTQLCAPFAPRLGASEPALLAAVRHSAAWYWSDAERHRTGRLQQHAARRAIVRHACAALGLAAGRAADELADAFTELREELVQPFAGALEALQEFRERGVRLGLLTNGSAAFQRRKIERFGLRSYFAVILIEEELGFGKPDARVFRRALAAVNAASSATWMVGDRLDWDITPAAALGMTTVWVDHARQGLPADSPVRPTRIVGSVAELCSDGGRSGA